MNDKEYKEAEKFAKAGVGQDDTVMPEKAFREKLLKLAKYYLCEYDYNLLINKYDTLLKNCKNENEKEAISAMGVLEVNNFFNMQEALYVNGKQMATSKIVKP